MNKIAGFKEGCKNVPLFVRLVKRLPEKPFLTLFLTLDLHGLSHTFTPPKTLNRRKYDWTKRWVDVGLQR
jgi:hypothetical protein